MILVKRCSSISRFKWFKKFTLILPKHLPVNYSELTKTKTKFNKSQPTRTPKTKKTGRRETWVKEAPVSSSIPSSV
jgi:hypothetical protein